MQMTDAIIVGALYRGIQRDHPWLVRVVKTSVRFVFVAVLKAHGDQLKQVKKIPLTTFLRMYRLAGHMDATHRKDGLR